MISLITNEANHDASVHDRPGITEGGGGMRSKTWNIQRAYPHIHVTNNYKEAGLVALLEPLVFHENYTPGDPDSFMKLVNEIKKSKRLNVLFAEEAEISRWTGNQQQAVFNAVDSIWVCNEYLQQQVMGFKPPVKPQILRTPIDADFYQPAAEKEKVVVATSVVSVGKNIVGIVDLFDAIRANLKDVTTVFVGNAEMWGFEMIGGDALQAEIKRAADFWYDAKNRLEMRDLFSKAAIYVNMSRYDVGSLSFLEAGMSGCTCLAWDNHPMFDEYVTIERFKDVDEAVKLIGTHIDAGPNTVTRTEIESHHSYTAFNAQLNNLIIEELKKH